MNYRHAFHAGNHCDVLKHAALTLALDRLASKDKPFFVLDTHAGRGLYDLQSDAARRSPEFEGGVARVFGAPDAPLGLSPWLAAVATENPFGEALRWYPGSPALIRNRLRDGDRAIFCELHPEELDALETEIGGDPRMRVEARDGYAAVKALTPPAERRGLILIDPPFEKPGEFDRIATALRDGIRRWPNGGFAIWLPIKDAAGRMAFDDAVARLDLADTLMLELSVAAARADKLTGSAMLFINPPFGVSAAMADALPWLARRLAVAPGGGWRLNETERGARVRAGAEVL